MSEPEQTIRDLEYENDRLREIIYEFVEADYEAGYDASTIYEFLRDVCGCSREEISDIVGLDWVIPEN